MSDKFLLKQRSSDPKDVEELISFARVYFATDFPNPSGGGCHKAVEIRNLISERSIPTDPLRQHLFECSNCFRVYSEMLAVRESSMREAAAGRSLVAFMRRPIVLVPVSVLLVVTFIVVILSFRRHDSSNYVASNGKATAIDSSTGSTQVEPTPLSPSPDGVRSVRIDFDSYRLHRGQNNGDQAIAVVGATRIQFVVILPEGSPAGNYLVTLKDARGEALRKISYHTAQKMFTADIDLSGLPVRRYWLCVSRRAESPNCYPIRVK
jgi:hypothetical protein